MENSLPSSGKYPFVGLTLAAVTGILLADHWPQPIWTSVIIVLIATCLWGIFRKTFLLLTFALSVFFLLHNLQFQQNTARQLAESLGKNEITIQGTGVVDSVPTESTTSNGKARSSFQIRDAELDLRNGSTVGPLSLAIKWPNALPQLGDRIAFEGNLQNVRKPRNPGEFDFANWLARQQIFSQITVHTSKNAHISETGSRWNLQRLANQSKIALANIITRDLTQSPIEAGVISAMMLGAKDDTPDSTLELFMKTGTLHLFSVSGLHVTMLAAITLFIFLAVRIPRRLALLLTIPTVFIYALITGWSPSSVRAALMTSAFVMATLLDRPSLSMNTLAVSCFLILIADTNQLFSTGFQLSFSVVGAILLLSGLTTRWLQTFTRPDPFIPKKLLTPAQKTRWLVSHRFCGNLGLTFSAWVGSLPLTAYYFNLLSPVALVANLLIIPLSFAILTLGVLSVAVSMVSSWLVIALNNASWGLVKLLLLLLGAFTAIPASSFFVGPHWWQLPHEERVTFFDLGSGGATVIETSSSCWLVDCGSEAEYRRVVRSYLQKRGINRVEGLFLTHGDGSHVGGVTQFMLDFPKAKIYLPEAGKNSLVFRRLFKDLTALHWISRAATFACSETTSLEVLWPPPSVDSRRADDHSLVLKLVLADQKFLLMGDSGFNTEMALLSEPANHTLKADWLVLGRNRDDPLASETLFEAVNAKSILSTAAEFPSVEQIPSSLVESCQKLKIQLLRFDETGAVQIALTKGHLEIETFAK